MFSNLSSSSISLPTVTVTASASMLTPFRIFSRASWEKRTILAAIAVCRSLFSEISQFHERIFRIDFRIDFRSWSRSALEHAENIVLSQDEMLFALELDLAP